MKTQPADTDEVHELRQALRQRTMLLIAVSAQAVVATVGLVALIVYFFFLDTDFLQATLDRGDAQYLDRMSADVSADDRAIFSVTMQRIRAAVQSEGIVAKDRYLEPLLYLGELWSSEGQITSAELQLFFQKVKLAEATDRQRRTGALAPA